jgi:hypothetical protein
MIVIRKLSSVLFVVIVICLKICLAYQIVTINFVKIVCILTLKLIFKMEKLKIYHAWNINAKNNILRMTFKILVTRKYFKNIKSFYAV